MAKALVTRIFTIDGCRVELADGATNGLPVVVLSVQLPPTSAFDDISIEYGMKTRRNAINFVEQANEAVAVRGKADCEARFAHLIERATHVFSNNAKPAKFTRSNPFKDKR